ncbi:50S ribosomal protein L22 [Spirochaetota bacterium]|nr:50S ribosomal protein L22 [Spirochaetota bacterium]
MQSQATKKYIRISRRKIARLGKLCSRKRLAEVKPRLAFLPQKSARVLLQTLKSAEANFLVKAPNTNTDALVIERLEINIARGFKRLLYRARGRGNRMNKRASHIHVVLTDEPVVKSSKKATQPKSPRSSATSKQALKRSAAPTLKSPKSSKSPNFSKSPDSSKATQSLKSPPPNTKTAAQAKKTPPSQNPSHS